MSSIVSVGCQISCQKVMLYIMASVVSDAACASALKLLRATRVSFQLRQSTRQ